MPFSDIKGHDNITLFFKRALGLNRVSHTYLFFGPDGAGKTLSAATLAKALNCLDMKEDSCDKCISCIKVQNKNHPDIMWVDVQDKRDSISIEQIRELQRQINLKPYEARTKVFIIQDSHRMTLDAANCLLKTLEEPADNSVIILITSRPEALPLTVRSRCKQIKFEPLELKFKIELAQQKGLSKEEALFLSKLENSSISIWNKVEEGQLFDYKNKVLEEFSSKKTLLDENSFVFSESKERMKFIISILESWFRDIFVLKAGGPSLFTIHSDRLKDLEGLRNKFSFEELEDIIKEIGNTQFCIERNVGPKLAFNNLKLKIKTKG